MRRTLRGVLAAALLCVVGCGTSASTNPTNVATTGRATFDKKPAAGALLLFHPAGEASRSLPSRAAVGPDGQFRASAGAEDDGLPEGEYVVTVEWRAGADENGAERPSVVPVRYTRRESSPLRVTVRRGADGRCDLGTVAITK